MRRIYNAPRPHQANSLDMKLVFHICMSWAGEPKSLGRKPDGRHKIIYTCENSTIGNVGFVIPVAHILLAGCDKATTQPTQKIKALSHTCLKPAN